MRMIQIIYFVSSALRLNGDLIWHLFKIDDQQLLIVANSYHHTIGITIQFVYSLRFQ